MSHAVNEIKMGCAKFYCQDTCLVRSNLIKQAKLMPQLWEARNEIVKRQVGLDSIWKVNPSDGLLTGSLTKVASGTQGSHEWIIALLNNR